MGIRTPVKAPATVKLERDGDVFTASVAKAGQPFQPIGAIALALPDPVYVGLAEGGYRGFVPIETLSMGRKDYNPAAEVVRVLQGMREGIAAAQ